MVFCRPATVRGVRTATVPSPSGPRCSMPSLVVSTDGRRHSLTLLHLPTAVTTYIRDQNVLEKRAREIYPQLRSLPNVERLIFHNGIYREAEMIQYLGVLSDWPKLRRIDTFSDVIKLLATLKHLHKRLPAVNTLSMEWTWRSQISQHDLVFWSDTLRDLTLIVRFVQAVYWM